MGPSSLPNLFSSYKQRAIGHGKPFGLSESQFADLVMGDCNYCGAKPSNYIRSFHPQTNKKYELTYNGIDRVNNDMGYVAGNCVTCCKNCNLAKRAMSKDEFLNWVGNVYRHSLQPGLL